ncbi:MAG: hypothetical protein HYS27_05190 [Deltaproteobacteria bacterium]|nr:hypothetical protein [Deltaproteobacteria bacterium]
MSLLLAAVQSSPLVTDAQPSGGAIRCTLALTELSATVQLGDLDDVARDLSLEGRLPPGEGRLSLTPERGLGGAVAALSEIEVDDKTVDDAWIIRGDGPALLLALVPALRPLAMRAPTIDVGEETVRIAFPRPIALVELASTLHAGLVLWERAVAFRQGAA